MYVYICLIYTAVGVKNTFWYHMKETIDKIDENKLPAKVQQPYKIKKLLSKREEIKEGVRDDFLNFVTDISLL